MLDTLYSIFGIEIEIETDAETETDTDTDVDIDIDIDKYRIFEFWRKFEFSSTWVLEYSNIEYSIFECRILYIRYSALKSKIETETDTDTDTDVDIDVDIDIYRIFEFWRKFEFSSTRVLEYRIFDIRLLDPSHVRGLSATVSEL